MEFWHLDHEHNDVYGFDPHCAQQADHQLTVFWLLGYFFLPFLFLRCIFCLLGSNWQLVWVCVFAFHIYDIVWKSFVLLSSLFNNWRMCFDRLDLKINTSICIYRHFWYCKRLGSFIVAYWREFHSEIYIGIWTVAKTFARRRCVYW